MDKITVIKRDGRKTVYDDNKIYNAVLKACDSIDKEVSDEDKQLANKIKEYITNHIYDGINVEEIQDLIEKKLMQSNRKDIAKSYILYREKRNRARYRNSELTKQMAEKLSATNIQNQNANVDEHSFGGRKGEADSIIMKDYALNYCMSEKSKQRHINNEIYIHDLDSYAVGQHNCLSVPFDKLLKNGFNTRQTDVRPARSVSTAFQLVAVIFQLQSLQQFGGVSATHIDWTMTPYVRMSFYKHYKDGLKYIEGIEDEKFISENINNEMSILDDKYKSYKRAYEYAYDMTVKEIYQSVEAMYHNLNTLQSRSGNQLPFTSLNYGTCTQEEGRLVTKALLEVSIEGIGKLHRTSVFPCGIFQYMKGVNDKEGTPNYDLYQLALKSTSLRLYPNYANVDWSGNTGYDRNDPRTYFSTMGCLGGKEHLYIKVQDDVLDVSIKEFFDMCKHGVFNGRKAQIFFNKQSNNENIKVKCDRNRPYEHKSGVYKITHIPTDTTYIGSTSDIKRRFAEHRNNIAKHGGLDGGVNYEDNNIENYIFEVIQYCENYKELEKEYIEQIPNVNFKGISQQYYKVSNAVKNQDLLTEKPNLQIISEPQDIINLEDLDIKVLDIDNKWVKVKHIFRNTPKSSPLLMHIYYKEYNHIYEIDATCDHPFYNGNGFTTAENLKIGDFLYRADGLPLEIINITWNTEKVETFDIGTESGTFVGSDIKMHNCRTANGWDINGFGQLKDGRGNICPVTIILPTIAMETKVTGDNMGLSYEGEDFQVRLDAFFDNLNDAIDDAKDMLIERFEWICSQPPSSATFMYENGTMEGYIPEEGIRSALKHGTLAVGQIGLAETLQILIGCDHTEEKGMELAKRIEQLFKDKCAEFKQKYKLNFGVYYTPAENLCYTAMKKFKDKYGVIPNVSENDFFTNSMHVPVWKNINIFEKINIESQLTGYSSAGCITYVEMASACKYNLKALESVINYAMEKDIPYMAINVPNDQCCECGYTDLINKECPICGSENIRRLRRVTGYLTGDYKTAFNKGKQQEVEMRVKHDNSWQKQYQFKN